jgi:hypothetical protein
VWEEGRRVVETALEGRSQEEKTGMVKEVNQMQEGGGRKGKEDRGRDMRGKRRGERRVWGKHVGEVVCG